MDIQAKPPGTSYGLMRATEAVTNWRALALTCMAGVVSFLFVALTIWLMQKSFLLGGLFTILTMVVWLIGYSSVGILLMRQAQGQGVSIMDAVMQATFSVHRLFGVTILLGLLFLGVALAALLVLFICKIPVLGQLLYAFAFPILTVLLGMTIAGMFYVGFPLAAPAIWEGNTAVQTIARLIGIVRKRLLPVITNLVILTILVSFISGVLFFVLFAGYGTTMGLSTSVGISPMSGITTLISHVSGLGGMGGMGLAESHTSYGAAFGFASGLLFTMGTIIPFLIFINGTCLVYLQAVEGLSFSETETKLREGIEEARRRTQEAKERAQAKMNEAKSAARPAMQPTMQPPVAIQASRICLKCNCALAPDDLFCGECGTKNPI